MIKHKYLEDIGIKTEDTPWGWYSDDTLRQEQWKSEREIYGFDERETWGLDTTFFYWLYERLMMFNEVNIINTEFYKIKIKDEELTLQECIDRIILGCKYYLKLSSRMDIEHERIAIQIGEEVIDIWKECVFYMWW